MIQLITPDRYGAFGELLAEMHRLRYRVFKERLGWEVEAAGDMEADEFDALGPAYLLLRGPNGGLLGCVRFLPSQGPTMLCNAFPALVPEGLAPATSDIWESSRFALDVHKDSPKAAGGLATSTYELFAGMVEFGLAKALCKILTVTDVRMERILRRATWPLERLGPPRAVGTTMAVAGYLEVSAAALARLRDQGGLKGPVLWQPVIKAA
jgi:acyl homoserine lactone synthase